MPAPDARDRGRVRYRITVRGELSAKRAAMLGDVEVRAAHGETIVEADVATPLALDALITRVGDLGLEIISLGQEDIALLHRRRG